MKNRIKRIEIKAREEKKKPMKVKANPEKKQIAALKKPKEFDEENFMKMKQGLEGKPEIQNEEIENNDLEKAKEEENMIKGEDNLEEKREVVEIQDNLELEDLEQNSPEENQKSKKWKRPTINRRVENDKIVLRYTDTGDNENLYTKDKHKENYFSQGP